MVTTQKTLSTAQHIVTNHSLEELKECEPLRPQWGPQEARHRIKGSLRPLTHADLQTESTKCTERILEI